MLDPACSKVLLLFLLLASVCVYASWVNFCVFSLIYTPIGHPGRQNCGHFSRTRPRQPYQYLSQKHLLQEYEFLQEVSELGGRKRKWQFTSRSTIVTHTQPPTAKWKLLSWNSCTFHARFCTFGADLYAQLCLLTKFLHRSSVGSLLRVRWLSVG